MRLSGLLVEAIQVSRQEKTVLSDVGESLRRLVSSGKGNWKSEKQARFLLDKIDHLSIAKVSEVKAFARKYAEEGQRVVPQYEVLRSPRRGRPGQWMARMYVVDDGGVVAAYRMGVEDPLEGGFDWDAKPKRIFKRKGKPAIVVDVRGERDAAKDENKKYIDQIASIPGWTDISILVSFVGQLSRGRRLSDKQKDTIQKFMPDPAAIAANQPMIKKVETALGIIQADDTAGFTTFPDHYEDMLQSFLRQLERGRELSARQKAVLAKVLPKDETVEFDRSGWARSYREFLRLVMEKTAKAWRMYDPQQQSPNRKDFRRFLAVVRKKGHSNDDSMFDRTVFEAVWRLAAPKGQDFLSREIVSFGALEREYAKAMKAKKPTLKAVRAMEFVSSAVEELEAINAEQEILGWLHSRLGSPPVAQAMPSEQLKKSLGGYTIPTPKQMGF